MPPTNILLITSDQQHYDTLGVTNPRIRTPHLDRLAAEGTRFDRAYCVNPTCSPSRATLITGMYPSAHGCWAIGVKLPEDAPTVGDIFQQHGYESILIDKAHFQPLRSEPGKPFFLWASFFDPHPPYILPEPWVSMYDPNAMQPGT